MYIHQTLHRQQESTNKNIPESKEGEREKAKIRIKQVPNKWREKGKFGDLKNRRAKDKYPVNFETLSTEEKIDGKKM